MATELVLPIACAALCCILFSLLFRRKPSRPLPPGPTGFPIIGALPLIGPSPHSSLAVLAKRYGPIMHLKMGTLPVVVASSPSSARSFLTTLDTQFAHRPTNLASGKHITYNFQDMVFMGYGPKLKLFRRLLNHHMLGPKPLAAWTSVRNTEIRLMLREVLESSKRSERVEVGEVLVCATANIIGQVMVSRRVFDTKNEAFTEFKTQVKQLLSGVGLFNIGDFVPAIAWMDLQGIQATNKKVHERLDKMLEGIFADHEKTKAEREGKPDLLDYVLANRSGGTEGASLTDDNIKGLISNMFIAGTDTSSIIVEWALAEMLKNPKILKRLQEELDQVIGQDRTMVESDIPNLPYLQAVVKEALRLHPSTPLSLPHYSFEPCEVDGYHIPANTRLLVNVWAIGRDPDVWERPLEFDPDRFLTGKTAKIEPHGNDFELIPFGAGRRICAGKQAGMIFVQYYLGVLVHAFDWAVPAGEEIDMEETPGMTLPKAVPIKAFAVPRLAPSAYA